MHSQLSLRTAVSIYRRLGNFYVTKKFLWCKIFVVRSICEIFLMVGGYKMDERLEHPSVWSTTRYRQSKVSLAVYNAAVRSSRRSDIYLRRYGRACTLLNR